MKIEFNNVDELKEFIAFINGSINPNLSEDDKKKQKRAEYDRQRYQDKKNNSNVKNCENDVEICENNVKNCEISQEEKENEKEEEKERTKEKVEEKVKEKEELINICAEPKIQTNPAKPQKHRYGEYKHVFLSDEDLACLQEEFKHDWPIRIKKLDEYLENNPSKHYANHKLTIQTWARKEAELKKQTQQATQPKKTENKTAYEMLVERGLA